MSAGELMKKETMRAVCIAAHGGAENLEVRERFSARARGLKRRKSRENSPRT